jgi:hypothetical protein
MTALASEIDLSIPASSVFGHFLQNGTALAIQHFNMLIDRPKIRIIA